MSDTPRPGIKRHGNSGWNKGCRCFVCRRGKAMTQARWRAKAIQPVVEGGPAQVPDETCMEVMAREVILSFDGTLSVEAKETARLMIATACLIDKIQAEGTWHLFNSTTKRYGELSREFRSYMRDTAGEGDGDDLLGSVGTFGAAGS